ncbi:MAG: hypothetical protein BLM47_00885 [Candidatus Reconcilbacillus cellulovorans]|uniref:Uncharacterized protein n=1 Tax=Candidatus Reconcilbacillus cellulovorans TaxID=1906605 RepID=A0A2A6E455_9BACL|nr:MAG: hypothetical protein BLM47_00885 [Candidatus Reconcilbacillus cellulovorans]
MSGWRHWSLAALGSAAMAAALAVLSGLLPAAEAPSGKEVFSPSAPRAITERNVVDFLADIPFRLSLLRAEWNSGVMEIDLALNGRAFGADAVYSDLERAAVHAFGSTVNVRRLLVRVLADEGGQRRLLAAMSAGREAWERAGGVPAQPGTDLKDWLERTFDVTYTDAWNVRFLSAFVGLPDALPFML